MSLHIQGSNQFCTKYSEFFTKLETGLNGGLPDEIRLGIEAIKHLDHKKDCLYNTINRQVKHFFIQYPK